MRPQPGDVQPAMKPHFVFEVQQDLLKVVLVGDVCQLSPFLESVQLMTNLDQMKDEDGEVFSPASQRSYSSLAMMEYADPPKILEEVSPRVESPFYSSNPKKFPMHLSKR